MLSPESRSVEGSSEHDLSEKLSTQAPQTKSGLGFLLLRVTGAVHGAFSSHEAETDGVLLSCFHAFLVVVVSKLQARVKVSLESSPVARPAALELRHK